LTNGFISATITFNDPSNYWLTGIYDGEQSGTAAPINPYNWIRSGTHKDAQGGGVMDPKYDDVEISPDPTNSHSSPQDAGAYTEKVTSTKTVTKNLFTFVAKTNVYVLHTANGELTMYYGKSTGRTLDLVTDTNHTPKFLVRLFANKWDTVYNNVSGVQTILVSAGDTLFIDSTYNQTYTQSIVHKYAYDNWVDPRQAFEASLAGVVAPGALAARSEYFKDPSGVYEYTLGPIPDQVDFENQRINITNSIDLVFTADKSKWTKCVVIEEGETSTDPNLTNKNEGGAKKFDVRKHTNPFVDGANGPIYNPGANPEVGTSWFPGYAVNIETGERLNIMFGEDSHNQKDNGNDMLWNPTNNNWQYGYLNPAAGYFD
jgi:hypothetical protein